MGTNPKAPIKTAFSKIIDAVVQDLKTQGYQVRYVTREGLSLLVVNESMCIGDNMETDLGQAINVTGCLDICSFETIRAVGHLVRQHVKVPRIIAFGGRGVRLEDLLHHIVIKDGHIGIDAPASGVYKKDYHVVHIGYGVDPKVQLPHVLAQKQIPTYLYGKVADIVEVELGSRYPCVDTNEAFDHLVRDLKQNQTGFYCLNVQETDLAGHAQDPCRYIDRINVSDQRIQETMSCLNKGDVLIVMADHGNDPTCGHSKHTREYVPILIYQSESSGINVGVRESLADVGATVAEYFGAKLAYGASFYHLIN